MMHLNSGTNSDSIHVRLEATDRWLRRASWLLMAILMGLMIGCEPDDPIRVYVVTEIDNESGDAVATRPTMEGPNETNTEQTSNGTQVINPGGSDAPDPGDDSMSAGTGNRPDSSAPLTYEVPEGWIDAGAGGMRVASFAIEPDEPTADSEEALITVIPLTGVAGGERANVNRWRQQVGMAAIDEQAWAENRQQMVIDDTTGIYVDLCGSKDNPDARRILACIIQRDRTTWFIKATGPNALLEKHAEQFSEFLKSIRFAKPDSPQ